ncbi:GNAT family N-acetyltransferase [Fictibacillus iocasae]|uniref:GNAT family N-acetyltransferase n=1 Tax=Fictibacillus iocasae TaxID=2715437 RepID=A0ABW2NTZ9_9BACL
MVTMKRFSELRFEEALSLWNEAFSQYYSDMTMDMDRFLQKISGEGLSLEHSVAAVHENKLVGFVLNGFREIDGKVYAWNGGTAILPECRGMKIGERLIAACLDIYKEKNADIAILEAISENTRAIRLYEKMGYETFEKLAFLKHEGEMTVPFPASRDFITIPGAPEQLESLPFHSKVTAWQTQLASIKDPRVALLQHNGENVGYAVYRHVYQNGSLAAILLYQCIVSPELGERQKEAAQTLLDTVFSPNSTSCRRITMNLPVSNTAVYESLLSSGFEMMVGQVHMKMGIKNRHVTAADSETALL